MKKVLLLFMAVMMLAGYAWAESKPEVRQLETTGNADWVERIICRLFGGKNKVFSTATRPLAGYHVDPSSNDMTKTIVRGYPREFNNQPPPLGQEFADKSRLGRIWVIDDQGTFTYMLVLGKHVWTVDTKTFFPAAAAAKMEIGLFPEMNPWNLTNWDVKEISTGVTEALSVRGGYRSFKKETNRIYLANKPFNWEDGGLKATFTGVSGEFVVDKSGAFAVSKSAIDGLLSTEFQQRGAKASGTVSQTEIVVSCLAQRLQGGKGATAPQAIAMTLDFLRDTQLDSRNKVILPVVLSYCLTEQ